MCAATFTVSDVSLEQRVWKEREGEQDDRRPEVTNKQEVAKFRMVKFFNGQIS